MVQKSLVFVFVVSLFPVTVLAESADVLVTLRPAGSFRATTKVVKGKALKSGNQISAENILVNLGELSSGIGLRDKHMKDRLNVTEFPTAKLIKATGKDGKGTGVVEIRGKKQDVAGTYKVEGKELVATFNVSLPGLDIKDIRYMGVGVKDEVAVTIRLPLEERSPASEK